MQPEVLTCPLGLTSCTVKTKLSCHACSLYGIHCDLLTVVSYW
jgi:hypothetical protein